MTALCILIGDTMKFNLRFLWGLVDLNTKLIKIINGGNLTLEITEIGS
jgi:hypothetical protein